MKLKNILLVALAGVSQLVAMPAYFTATEHSLKQYQVPEWYQDAKLGYWVHWGIFSVPAHAEGRAASWYGRNMYDSRGVNRESKIAAYHRAHYGDPKEFGYKDFVPMWKAEKFDPEAWADLFQEGGAKFFTMLGMHHDNFPLWDSQTTPFNAANYGPKKDLVAMMEKAIRKRGMRFGLSNHSAWNSRFFELNHKNKHDVSVNHHSIYGNAEPNAEDVALWWARSTEMVEKYHPDLVWFDWCWAVYPYGAQLRLNFAAWYYNQAILWGMASKQSPEVVIAHKNHLPAGTAVLDFERGGVKDIHPHVWMNDTSMGIGSWSYEPNDTFRTANQVIDMLIDIVSKNGNLLSIVAKINIVK